MFSSFGKLILLLIFSLASNFVRAGAPDSLKVVVTDENNKPVPGLKVKFEDYPVKTTNSKGSFSFLPTQKIELPFDIELLNENYALEDYEFANSEKTVYVSVKKVYGKQNKLMVVYADGKPVPNYQVMFGKKKLVTDKMGIAFLKADKLEKPDLKVADDIISIEKKESDFVLTISKKIAELAFEENAEEVLAQTTAEEPKTDTTKTTFQQYQAEFKLIEKELEFERNQIDQLDANLKAQLAKITAKLQGETSLSEEEKQELLKYEAKLYQEIADNIDRFNQSKKKVFEMMESMRFALLEKDSVNRIMEQRLLAEQEKLKVIEMQAKRQAIIYIIIILTMLLLAFVFYGIARKIRTQKKELSLNNEKMETTLQILTAKISSLKQVFVNFYVQHKGLVVQELKLEEVLEKKKISVLEIIPGESLAEREGKSDWWVEVDKDLMAKFWEDAKANLGKTDWSSTAFHLEESPTGYVVRVELGAGFNKQDGFWENYARKSQDLEMFEMQLDDLQVVLKFKKSTLVPA